ncbi:restriction endonuclease [Streptomyces sp. A7024]|uniref:Restriction endonuclease n=1 Tax=Streptomyces coryli TaxID=1128680 RepID=A0A6G4UCT3_9ACTN|nr:restriction endonuclease [Streptomyces coryli]NGN69486.1 restriction endonuclease [Streptomyces coryli]
MSEHGETALLESRTLRDSVMRRTEVLDRVKALSLLPDGTYVTTAMVAAYFEVGENVIRAMVHDHQEELAANGYRVLSGAELSYFKQLCGMQSKARAVALFSRRTVLNVAMLLRDSEVARQVRIYLLDIEEQGRQQPVDNLSHELVESLVERMERTAQAAVGRLLPMINALIESAGEQRRATLALTERAQRMEVELTRVGRDVQGHELALQDRTLAGVMADIDAMNWRDFELYVAELCIRDGCTNVRVIGGKDRGVDIVGVTPDGSRLIVQCKRYQPFRSVWSADMQRFLGAAKVQHRAEVALFVASCPFSREALAIAREYGVTPVDRAMLQVWAAGSRLQPFT